MIPKFPEFKHVEVEDREAVEAFTHKYPPYSDFNFTSLWSWDTSNERMVSVLNDNLVVRFTDYSTHAAFLSFLGENDTEKTARELLEYSAAEGMPAELRLVPSVSIQTMRPSVLVASEDVGNFDYVFDIPLLAKFPGAGFATKRRDMGRFRRANPNVRIEIVDFNNADVQARILGLLDVWEKNKKAQNKTYEVEHERAAVQRLAQTAQNHSLLVTGIFNGEELIAFSIEELLPNQWALGHFWKADIQYEAIYDVLIHEKAKHFETLQIATLNYEQDLGILELRRSKMAYRPVDFLKKYTVHRA